MILEKLRGPVGLNEEGGPEGSAGISCPGFSAANVPSSKT